MTKIVLQKWEELDLGILADVSAKVRKSEGLGDYTSEQVEEHLKTMNQRFPIEVVVLAIEEDEIVGWSGIERVTENIGEVRRWHPFVISSMNKESTARRLISSIIDYAKSNEMTRIEVAFGGISEENLETFKTRCSWYEAEGWNKLEDTNFMVLGPISNGPKEIKPPEGFEIRPLLEFENDAIFECYHEAFITGDARWIYDMTEEQRKQEFDKNFDRSHQINEGASFAILSNRAIVGFILVVSRSDEEDHLESIGILPKFRWKGLGKTLLGKSIEALRKKEAQNLTLGVDPVNTPAVGLYEKFGFETTSRIARYSWKISGS